MRLPPTSPDSKRRTRRVRITSVLSEGEGLLLGEVYDDRLGVPLAGAHIRLTGPPRAPVYDRCHERAVRMRCVLPQAPAR
jgi:hypothetical protein